jgi:hypothetical protein
MEVVVLLTTLLFLLVEVDCLILSEADSAGIRWTRVVVAACLVLVVLDNRVLVERRDDLSYMVNLSLIGVVFGYSNKGTGEEVLLVVASRVG